MDAHTTAVVRTVGHSNRTLEAFLHLLRAHQVTLVVDVRKMPGSRRNAQFNRDTLPNALHEAGIGYVHLPDLGGLRHRTPSSPNAGWKNASFQGYADYMLTPEFERSLDDLLKLAREHRTALMCAEAVPWRCHRSLSPTPWSYEPSGWNISSALRTRWRMFCGLGPKCKGPGSRIRLRHRSLGGPL